MASRTVGDASGTLTLERVQTTISNTTNPIRRDTRIIPDSSKTILRFEATNPGLWFTDCHIDWHLAHGLASVVIDQSEAIARMTIPASTANIGA